MLTPGEGDSENAIREYLSWVDRSAEDEKGTLEPQPALQYDHDKLTTILTDVLGRHREEFPQQLVTIEMLERYKGMVGGIVAQEER